MLLSPVEGEENTYESEAFEFKEGDEFKARKGWTWAVNIGADGTVNGPNFKIEADQAGTYKVRVVVTVEGDEVTGGEITLVAAE